MKKLILISALLFVVSCSPREEVSARRHDVTDTCKNIFSFSDFAGSRIARMIPELRYKAWDLEEEIMTLYAKHSSTASGGRYGDCLCIVHNALNIELDGALDRYTSIHTNGMFSEGDTVFRYGDQMGYCEGKKFIPNLKHQLFQNH